MESLGKHEVFDLVTSASAPADTVIGTKWMFQVNADHTLKRRVVCWGQVPAVDCRCTHALVCRTQSIQMPLVNVSTTTGKNFKCPGRVSKRT